MGIYVVYQRITPAQLAAAVGEPPAVWDLLDESGPGDSRVFDLDKAWQEIMPLLVYGGVPQSLVEGRALEGANDYFPPHYLTPDEVREVARLLEGLPTQKLLDLIDDEFRREHGWQPDADDTWVQYVAGHYTGLPEYFRAAAAAGEAVIVWLR